MIELILTRQISLVILIMFALVCTPVSARSVGSFDLNEMPTDEEVYENRINNICMILANSPQSPPTNTIGHRQANRIMELYQKVLMLMDVLKKCDTDEFDIDSIDMQESFDAEKKAVMALSKVAGAKLIKQSDQSRYERIMANFSKILAKLQQKTLDSMSIESQMSGVICRDLDKLRRGMEDSPLENLKTRFTGDENDRQNDLVILNENTNAAAKPQQPINNNQEKSNSLGILRTGEPMEPKDVQLRNFL